MIRFETERNKGAYGPISNTVFATQPKDCDMKVTIGSAVLCMGLLSASASAQMVWKCEVGGNVTYQ